MKARGAAVQGALALAGLALAYGTWQREPDDASPDEVVALAFSKGELQEVRYEDEKRWVELGRPPGAEGLALKVGNKPLAVPSADAGLPVMGPDGGAVAAGTSDAGVARPPPPAPVLPPAPDRELVANEAAERLFAGFAPMKASRALGVLEPAKLKELGLQSPTRRLTVKGARQTATFDVGASPLGGNTYLRAQSDGKVYLVRGSLVTDLETASTRLVDKRLHAFAKGDVESVVVEAGGKSRSWVRLGPAGGDLKLAVAGSPEQADEFAKNWHDKVWSAVAVDLLGRGENPGAGKPEVKTMLRYRAKGKELGFAEVGTAGKDAWLRTEHTASWVKLNSSFEATLEEVKRVLAEVR